MWQVHRFQSTHTNWPLFQLANGPAWKHYQLKKKTMSSNIIIELNMTWNLSNSEISIGAPDTIRILTYEKSNVSNLELFIIILTTDGVTMKNSGWKHNLYVDDILTFIRFVVRYSPCIYPNNRKTNRRWMAEHSPSWFWCNSSTATWQSRTTNTMMKIEPLSNHWRIWKYI